MMLKIIFVIAVTPICSGAPPQYPRQNSNQAIYSQSFIRKDIPISYEYSATHDYTEHTPNEETPKWQTNFPNKHEPSYEEHSITNHNDWPIKSLSKQTYQYAPVPVNPKDPPYQVTPVLYTSIVPEIAIKEEKIDVTENLAKSTLNLEPKQITVNEKIVDPTTYRPNMNHDIKMFNSHFRKKAYKEPKQTFEMAGARDLAIYQKLQQQLDTRQKYTSPHLTTITTTHNPKKSNRVNLGVIIPKLDNHFATTPYNLIGSTMSFYPIPRLAYRNKFDAASRKPIPTRNKLYLDKQYSALLNMNRFKPNVQL